MSRLQGTQTLHNLMKAFAGESQAHHRYSFFASTAKKAGFKQIEALFLQTAAHELKHAKQFYKLMTGDLGADSPVILDLAGSYPVVLGATRQNLLAAAAGEHEEWTELYPAFTRTADQEGLKDIAVLFRLVAGIEQHHEARFRQLADNLATGRIFQREQPVAWFCIECGYIYEGTTAPSICPVCKHPQGFFEILADNY